MTLIRVDWLCSVCGANGVSRYTLPFDVGLAFYSVWDDHRLLNAACADVLDPDNFRIEADVVEPPKPKPLTVRQRAIMDQIEESIAHRGVAPSFEEIARHQGYRSLATVHEHLTNLERKGWIRRTHNESRAIRVVEAA